MLKKGGIELSTSTIIILIILLLVLVLTILIATNALGGFGKDIIAKLKMALGIFNQSAKSIPK